MPLNQYYSEQIQFYQNKVEKAGKKENNLSIQRLVSFVGALVLFYLTLNISLGLATILLIMGLVLFGYSLKQHLAITREKEHLTYLLEINEKELACIHGDFQNYPDGKEYQDNKHPYTGDLDIFGRSSLFQYINRTTSKTGSDLLAEWLKNPADLKEIIERQEAITELKSLSDWRQHLIAIGYKYADAQNNPEPVMAWLKEEPVFLQQKYLKIVINASSILTLGAFIGWLAGVSISVFSIIIAIDILVLNKTTHQINKIHKGVSRTSELLKAFEQTIKTIEKQHFNSGKLVHLQKKFTYANDTASLRINELSHLVNKLDFRLNVFVAFILNLFYFWDIRQILKLEHWKMANRDQTSLWFETMAEFEALSSLANLYYNNPDWMMPAILPDHFHLNAEEIGHPLIPKKRRVCNNLHMDRAGKIAIVTGSNMSGKSTFLRTIGTNMILAMTGAPVCARKFATSKVLVLTSMRIIDSLEENTSSFYAELKRLAGIIQSAERNEKVFLLLDEILRGTNSNDRHIGSVALIRQLVKSNAVGILATHDLALSQLEEELPQAIDNYNFDVKIENDELFFDYKLTKGICKSLNASILMKKMGIHVK
jgi:hypothetical protein